MSVVVIGGGIAGLAAAYELVSAGVECTLVEAASQLGGQIRTRTDGEFVIECGAEGYASRSTEVTDLCRSLKLTDRLVSQIELPSLVLRDGKPQVLSQSDAAAIAGIHIPEDPRDRGITSVIGGMAELTRALECAIAPRARLMLDASVTTLDPSTKHNWDVTTAGGRSLRASAVILATPARTARQLVSRWAPLAGQVLSAFRTSSSVTVTLAVRREAVSHGLGASGLVAETAPEEQGFRACRFVSSVFPRHAPRGQALLRAFLRPGPTFPITSPDATWLDLAVSVLWPVLEITEPPARVWIARWPNALARYDSDHEARMETLRVALGAAGLVYLAGAAYQPAGVAGAVQSGRMAAKALLGASPPESPALRKASV